MIITYKDIVKDCRLAYVEVYWDGNLIGEISNKNYLWIFESKDKNVKLTWDHEPILDNVKSEIKLFFESDNELNLFGGFKVEDRDLLGDNF